MTILLRTKLGGGLIYVFAQARILQEISDRIYIANFFEKITKYSSLPKFFYRYSKIFQKKPN